MDSHDLTIGPLSLDHVDVFTDRPLAGNGVAVVTPWGPLAETVMLGIAQELRQFETIFLFDVADDAAEARIFTPEEELNFAGHPVLGAAAVLHARSPSDADRHWWTIRVGGRPLSVTTVARPRSIIAAEMDQGPPTLSPPLAHDVALQFATALGLRSDQLREDLPSQVVSTGLPYLLLPVTAEGLAASQITVTDLPSMLSEIGAAFVYVLDPDTPEGRTWDNRGATEDIATGSAAGPTAAYLISHGLRPRKSPFRCIRVASSAGPVASTSAMTPTARSSSGFGGAVQLRDDQDGRCRAEVNSSSSTTSGRSRVSNWPCVSE